MSTLAMLQRRVTLAGLHSRVWLGSAGAMGLLLLALAVGAFLWAPKVARDAAALQGEYEVESAKLRNRTLQREADPAIQMREFHDGFPDSTQYLADLRTIFRAAREQQVLLPQGDYSTTRKVEAGLTARDVVLPVKANYAALRAFVASVLNALPNASLVELRLERTGGNQLNARVHLTLYYRET